jgi:hypothetical protein
MARLDLDIGTAFLTTGNEVVTSASEKLRTKISGKFDAEILLHELETIAKVNTTNRWTFTTPRAMIRGAIICLFILFCYWKMCRSSGPAPVMHPAPSAPPAHPTIFNMTVDHIQR